MSWYNEALAGWYRSKINSANAMEAGIASFGSAIGKAIEETRQNSMANQIGTQEGMGPVTAAANSGAYAPRAELYSPGTNPDTGDQNQIAPGTSTAGTAPAHAPFTGGYKGLQLQTAIDSLRRQQANTQSEMDLRGAQGDYYRAHTNVIQQNADTMRDRANTYRDRVNQRNNPQVTPQQFEKSAKALLPKGIDQGWVNVLSGNLPFQRGDLDQDGNWKASPTGMSYSYGNTPEDLAKNVAPVATIEQLDQQVAKMRSGGGGNQQQGPTTGGGNQLAVTTPLSPDEARAMVRSGQLKPGDWFPGNDGMSYQVPPTQP